MSLTVVGAKPSVLRMYKAREGGRVAHIMTGFRATSTVCGQTIPKTRAGCKMTDALRWRMAVVVCKACERGVQ